MLVVYSFAALGRPFFTHFDRGRGPRREGDSSQPPVHNPCPATRMHSTHTFLFFLLKYFIMRDFIRKRCFLQTFHRARIVSPLKKITIIIVCPSIAPKNWEGRRPCLQMVVSFVPSDAAAGRSNQGPPRYLQRRFCALINAFLLLSVVSQGSILDMEPARWLQKMSL